MNAPPDDLSGQVWSARPELRFGTRSELTAAVSNLEKGAFLRTDSIMLVFIMACFMALAGNMFLCRCSAVLLTATVSSSF